MSPRYPAACLRIVPRWSSCARLHDADPNHRIARDQLRELFLAHSVGSRGTLWDNEVALLGAAVPYAHGDIGGKLEAEFHQHSARVAHHARAIREALVPDRRQPQHRPWIT